MKYTTLVVCVLLTMSCLAQQSINLPKDNGSTVSFCESLDLGREAKAFYDTACVRLSSYIHVRSTIVNGNEAIGYLHFTEMQQGIYGKVTFVRSGKYVNYCIQDFKVNNMPLEEWLGTANSTIAEQVKGRIFSSVVMLVAQCKNNTTPLTQR